MTACNDRPNLVERAVFKLGEPKYQALLLQVAWRISLLMMVLGFIIMIKTIYPDFMWT
jgi:hypothetical protein